MRCICPEAWNFIKKERLRNRCFPANFKKFLRALISFEHLRTIVSGKCDEAYNHANMEKQPSRGFLRKKCSENTQQIHSRTPMPKCDFNKVAKQLYWNPASAWMFSCKFDAYFQNTFSSEHLWRAAAVTRYACTQNLEWKRNSDKRYSQKAHLGHSQFLESF